MQYRIRQVEGKNVEESNEKIQTFVGRKGKFGKFGPWKGKKNLAKIQYYGCKEYGHYKKYCPKLNKGSNVRDR